MKELMIKQSNALILATHDMNLQQMRLFFFACSQYNGELTVEVTTEDLYRVLAPQSGGQQELLRKAIPTMMRNAFIHIKDETGEEWSSVFTKSRLENNNVKFIFNESVQKELEELRGYTWMYLTQITGMSSTYSIRLYEFCAMRLGANNHKGKFDFELNYLRTYLNCEKKYTQFREFNRNVLAKAVNEINEKSNIEIKYSLYPNGRGKKITNIIFKFKWKNKDDAIDVSIPDHHAPESPGADDPEINMEEFERLRKELKEGTL